MGLLYKCVIDIDIDSFESWLTQYHPDKNIIIKHDQFIAEIVDSHSGISNGNIQRVIGSPWVKKMAEGNNRFFISISPDISMSSQEYPHLEDCLLLTTKYQDINKTAIYLNFDEIILQPYIIDLLDEIQENYPESKREAQKITLSPYKRDPNHIVDEFVIELDPEVFFQELTTIISEDDLDEREFFHLNDLFRIHFKLCTYEIFPEDGPNRPWEYQLFATLEILSFTLIESDAVFRIDKSYIGNVTLKHLGLGRYHVKFLMDYEIPDLEKFLEKLSKKTRMIYSNKITEVTPRTQSKKRGPTEATKHKANIIREIQEAHPDWTKLKVAMEAGRKLNQGIQVHDVDNAYKAMGWGWTKIKKHHT